MTDFAPRFFEKDPLFWPIAAPASAFAERSAWPTVAEYGTCIAHAAPVRFREQPKKPRRHRRAESSARDLYDGRIVEEGWVPTRPGSWHDFLNMLVWAAFPTAKWQLHVRQHRAQRSRLGDAPVRALPNARTREQDALALLDEGGAIVLCREPNADELRAALAERRAADAREIFLRGDACAVVFGHAIYEGLVLHREPFAGDAWAAALVVPSNFLARDSAAIVRAADTELARVLATEGSFMSPGSLARLDLAIIRP